MGKNILVSACLLGICCRYDGKGNPNEKIQRLLNREDVTDNFIRGAEAALQIARLNNCRTAILKERSPSCGCGRIYDGSFSGTLKEGNGITAEILIADGIRVYGESQIPAIFD